MHLKRQKSPKRWPITRKGTTFVVRPKSKLNNGIPMLIILRDMLKLGENRREIKKAINVRNILLNTKPIIDDRIAVSLFDTITIVPEKKSYRLELNETGKFVVHEIKEAESGKKVAKIVDKKILNGGKVQLNMNDGSNFISDLKCNVNDSIVIDFKKKKAEKCLPMHEKAKVFVFDGKHTGKRGTIEKIDLKNKMAEVNYKGSPLNVLIKQLIVSE